LVSRSKLDSVQKFREQDRFLCTFVYDEDLILAAENVGNRHKIIGLVGEEDVR